MGVLQIYSFFACHLRVLNTFQTLLCAPALFLPLLYIINQIEGISWQKVRDLDPDHRVAIVLSAQAARLIYDFPFTSWEESRLAHHPGPAKALS
jgi:hypothetical protein